MESIVMKKFDEAIKTIMKEMASKVREAVDIADYDEFLKELSKHPALRVVSKSEDADMPSDEVTIEGDADSMMRYLLDYYGNVEDIEEQHPNTFKNQHVY
jgi:uncharacterized short protein YbdD (DUF466 family)